MKKNKITLGSFLREKRRSRALTQGEVARKLGYGSAQFISNIERDCCAAPVPVLNKMVRLYRLPKKNFINLLTNLDRERWEMALSA